MKGSRRFLTPVALSLIMLVTALAGCAQQPPQQSAPAAPASQPASPPPVQAKEVKMSMPVSPETVHHKAGLEFAKVVEEKSGGSLKVGVFPNQFGGDNDLFQHVREGTLQIAMMGLGNFASLDERFTVTDLPFLFANYGEARKALAGPALAGVAESMSAKGFRILGFGEQGFRMSTSSKRAIKTPADLKGQRFRVPQWKSLITYFKAIGADPVPMPWPEVYTSLQTKAIDGQENALTTVWGEKLYEVQKHLSLTGHSYQAVVVVANEKWYQSLSDKEKQALTEAFRVYQQKNFQGIDDLEKDALAKLKEKGMEINEVDKAAFQAPARDVWKELLPKQQELIEKVLADAKK